MENPKEMKTLAIQEALRNGETPQSLREKLGINSYEHPTEPLIGFKYDQLDSPKTNPIVREARGIVLERDTWNVIAKPFNRFFNAGEDFEQFKKFDWNDFSCIEKADGSLIICYYYNGQWLINTSGSFGLREVSFTKILWHDLFKQASMLNFELLDKNYTYLFELCSVYNKVVRTYVKPTVYLLGCIETLTFQERTEKDCDEIAKQLVVPRPERFEFSSIKEIVAFLDTKADNDPTFEGVIIRDSRDMRYKIKNKTYLSLHHMKDNGNLFNPKNLVPWALKEDPDELLIYFPETKEALENVKVVLDDEWKKLKQIWQEAHQIEDQKHFAMKIKDQTRFASLLFTNRKCRGDERNLKELWRASKDLITKALF